MNEMKSKTYTQSKKLICDCTNKKNYLTHYTMLKFYVEHGMVVEKVLEINPFKRNKWFDKSKSFNIQKRNKDKIGFEKDFYKLLNISLYGKTMENVRLE